MNKRHNKYKDETSMEIQVLLYIKSAIYKSNWPLTQENSCSEYAERFLRNFLNIFLKTNFWWNPIFSKAKAIVFKIVLKHV